MSKLKWVEMTRFEGDTHWFAGIYKINSYKWHQGHAVEPFYQVYKLCANNWGDYVDRHKQGLGMLTLQQAKDLAQQHCDENEAPHHSRLKVAKLAIERWMEPHKGWAEKQSRSSHNET